MRRLIEGWRRVRSVWRRNELETGLDEEIRFHIDRQTEKHQRAGMAADEARRQALIKFGGVGRAKESTRDQFRAGAIEDFVRDIRHGGRALLRAPGFTIVATLTLALGIGATTAMFSALSAILVRPLPYPDADRMVRLWSTGRATTVRHATALPDYRDWRTRNGTLEDLGAHFGVTSVVTGTDRPDVMIGARMTASIWKILQTQPLAGRLFTEDEETWGRHRSIVISEGSGGAGSARIRTRSAARSSSTAARRPSSGWSPSRSSFRATRRSSGRRCHSLPARGWTRATTALPTCSVV